MNQANTTLLIVLCVLLTTAGQIALKIGASNPLLVNLLASGNTFSFITRAAFTPLVIAGLVLYGASTLLWLLVLARADLGYAYPLISMGFILTALYGHLVLHEPLTAVRITGIVLIVLGVACVSRS